MAPSVKITPSRSFREELTRRGGGSVGRCFQCATCSSVCDLSTEAAVFPRRQMLWAQWGLRDKLLADPSIWLCHECTDCTARCPRDARPSDVLKGARAMAIEAFGAPAFLARLVGNASTTWPILLGAPVAFWAVLVYLTVGFNVTGPLAYNHHIPNGLIDGVFVPAALFATLAAVTGARRAWNAWGEGVQREGTLMSGLVAVAGDILAHRRFGSCGTANTRKGSHTLLVWGFLAAFVTTGSVATAEYVFGAEIPLAQVHPIKLLGNTSAVLLSAGLVGLWLKRSASAVLAGRTTAFDTFFFRLLVLLVGSGIGSEVARYTLPAQIALSIYIFHLGMVLAFFLTFPFSKFAHALYRTLALAHERLARTRRPQ